MLMMTRRSWLKLSAQGTFGVAAIPLFHTVARAAADGSPNLTRPRLKQCIFYTMNGGPSQVCTFDPKPGGAIPAIQTSVPGIQICSQYPYLAKQIEHIAFLRGMSFKRAAHDGGVTVHSGYPVKFAGGVSRPTIGAIVAKELTPKDFELPTAVTMSQGYYNAGFLGARYAPFNFNIQSTITPNARSKGPIQDRVPSTSAAEFDRRIDLIEALNRQFHDQTGADSVNGHTAAYRGAQRLVHTDRVSAFDISREPEHVLNLYGLNDPRPTGFEKTGDFLNIPRQALVARRLIEVGVPFIEMGGGGWDSHAGATDGSYQDHRYQGWQMDKPMAALIADLRARGLLDNVLIVMVGEFGRTGLNGTNHNNKAFTAALAGAGLKTGQVIGATSATGDEVVKRPVSEHQFMATMLKALGIDPAKEYQVGSRPVPVVDRGTEPVNELF